MSSRVRALRPVPPDVEYPESDGEPMGETDVHIDELIATRESLKHHFRDAGDVYVAGNLLVYYEEGEPKSRFSPDVFVVKGVPKGRRRTYKLWVEGRPPSVVFEMSSRKTWRDDVGKKKALCARLGVEEYFLFDPDREYLDPPLQGFRLVRGLYRPLPPADDGALSSRVLGLTLRVDGTCLRLVDPATGQRLPRLEELLDMHRRAEQDRERADHEKQRADLEKRAKLDAERRLRAGTTELEQLRRQLARRRPKRR